MPKFKPMSCRWRQSPFWVLQMLRFEKLGVHLMDNTLISYVIDISFAKETPNS
jgi:hypothetical protein